MRYVRWFIGLFRRPPAPNLPAPNLPAPNLPDPIRVKAGKKAAATRKRRMEYMEAIELVSDLLSVKQYKAMSTKDGGKGVYAGYHHAKPKDFNYIEPVIICEAMPEFYPDLHVANINIGTTLQQMDRPLDFAMITNWIKDDYTGNHDAKEDGKAVFRRIRHVSKEQVRGRVRMYMPYMVEDRFVMVNRFKRKGESVVLYYGSADLEDWFAIGTSMVPGHADSKNYPEDHAFIDQLGAMSGFAKSREDKWVVGLQRPNQPAMSFPTDPIGVREVFRLRDIPEGKQRRASMIHWVDAHYRKKHDDPSALTYVRKHLRGGTKFTWNGLICTVKPPHVDAAFSKRRDLMELREEGIITPAAIPVDLIPTPLTSEETERLAQALKEGEATTFPANRSGSWLGIKESER